MTDDELNEYRNFDEHLAELEELSKSALRAGYDELMYNDLVDMQEQAFEVINEKAKERYPDEFDAYEGFDL